MKIASRRTHGPAAYATKEALESKEAGLSKDLVRIGPGRLRHAERSTEVKVISNKHARTCMQKQCFDAPLRKLPDGSLRLTETAMRRQLVRHQQNMKQTAKQSKCKETVMHFFPREALCDSLWQSAGLSAQSASIPTAFCSKNSTVRGSGRNPPRRATKPC